MKEYYLQFDFFNDDVSKFFGGVIKADLRNDGLMDVCKKIIEDTFYGIDPESVTIKVNALNNIDI